MTRRGCIEAVAWTSIWAIALAAAVPQFLTIKVKPPIPTVKDGLKDIHKECVFLQASGAEGRALNLLNLGTVKDFVPPYIAWRIVDKENKVFLDPDQACFKAHLLAIPTDSKDSYNQLAYGLDLANGQKSCITREGDKRDDWSC